MASTRKRVVVSAATSLASIGLLASVIVLVMNIRAQKQSSVMIGNSSADASANVLFISSNTSRFSSSNKESGLSSIFSAKNINLDPFYFDSSLEIEGLQDYYRNTIEFRNKSKAYDAVIASGAPAIRFMEKYKDDLFPSIPIVFFSSETKSHAEELGKTGKFCGFYSHHFIEDTIVAAKKIYPYAKEVVAIYDNSATGIEHYKKYIDASEKFPGMNFTGINVSELTQIEFQLRLHQIEKNTIVIFISALNYKDGFPSSFDEQLALITDSIPVPLFSFSTVGIARRTIGGKLVDFEQNGAAVAELVLRLLDGESPESIGVHEYCQGKYYFDKSVMSHYGITEKMLPKRNHFFKDYILINGNYNVGSTERNIYLAVIFLVVFLVGFVIIASILTLSEHRKSKQLKTSNERMAFMYEHDNLTHLPNRLSLQRVYDDLVKTGKRFAIFLIDIDDFKNINDYYSHSCGDEVLKVIANRFQELMRGKVFYVGRLGGDEFLVIYSDGNVEDDSNALRSIKNIFEKPVVYDNKRIFINTSIGVANYEGDNQTFDEITANADISMYQSKKNGKNKATFFDSSMKETIKNSNEIIQILNKAISNDGISVVFQPQYDCETGGIHGYEALVRLKESTVSPSAFISVAEESGLIIKIDRIVTEKVIQQMAEWRDRGIPLYKTSINYSYGQISDVTYVDFLAGLLNQYNIPANLICIEITESLFIANKDKATKLFEDFKKIGVSLALDDFGTGYSSLSYLTYLPVDVVKVDKSLVDNYLNSTRDAFIKNIVRLVHSLDMKLTVEGVETEVQLEKLKDFHCDYIQGYIYSRPIPPEAVEGFLKEKG